MKRWLWFITAGLIAGVSLASFIARDPGYALVQVAGYRLETSLVALILAAAALFIFMRFAGRLVGGSLRTTNARILPGHGRVRLATCGGNFTL